MTTCEATKTLGGHPFICVLEPHPRAPDEHFMRRASLVDMERAAKLLHQAESRFHREVAKLLDLSLANQLTLTSTVPRQLELIATAYLAECGST